MSAISITDGVVCVDGAPVAWPGIRQIHAAIVAGKVFAYQGVHLEFDNGWHVSISWKLGGVVPEEGTVTRPQVGVGQITMNDVIGLSPFVSGRTPFDIIEAHGGFAAVYSRCWPDTDQLNDVIAEVASRPAPHADLVAIQDRVRSEVWRTVSSTR